MAVEEFPPTGDQVYVNGPGLPDATAFAIPFALPLQVILVVVITALKITDEVIETVSLTRQPLALLTVAV